MELAERGAAIIEAMGLRELLRASREQTMPIDRSRIRKGMLLVLDQPLPDYTPNGRRRLTNVRPIALSDSPRATAIP